MANSTVIKALIVDDEVLARERIRELIQEDSEVELLGECSNGQDAVRVIRETAPDLLFLDVQMPRMDGFAVLRGLAQERLPRVIFVTAYDRYALRAFEVYALDYLLKPFDKERFCKALHHAKIEIERDRHSDRHQGLLGLLDELRKGSSYLQRLVVKSDGRVYFLKAEEIDWVEAQGNYVQLHSGRESHLIRETLSSLESQLNPRQFLRIHRSTIVNMDRIKELQPWFRGEFHVLLRDGTQLLLSRKYREKLSEVIGKPV